MSNFDRAFEALLVWITLLVILASLLFSWVSSADELPPIPYSETHTLNGKKYECYETEQYRQVVQYVKVVAPALQFEVASLRLLLQQTQIENTERYRYAVALEQKLQIYHLDLTATRTELDDVKDQINRYRNGQRRVTVVHYIIHGLGLVAVISLGTAYGLERIK